MFPDRPTAYPIGMKPTLISPASLEAARAHYHEAGYHLMASCLPRDLLDSCQTLLEAWVDAMAEKWMAEGRLSDLHREEDFRSRFNVLWQKAGKPVHERSPRGSLVKLDPSRVWEILRHPALVDLAQTFLGTEEIVAHGAWNSRPKTPDATFTDTPWHQDGQYFREQAHLHIMTVWFPLHPVTEASSCLAVAPEFDPGHLFENFTYPENGFIGLKREDALKLKALPVPMEAGDALVFPQSTPHRAMPNRSNQVRWSMDLRFVAAEGAHPGALAQGALVRSKNPDRLTRYHEWLRKWEGETR